jgi:glycosyltransferase involved in cell wall biosynthesis
VYGPSQHDPVFQRRLGELAASVGAALGGRIERSAMPARLASIDLLVVPSLWFENSPLVILEARAARTPLLVSDLGGMAELVERGRSGEHFRVGDVDDLARALTELLTDPARLARLSESSVRPPSVDDHVGELEKRFESVRRTEPC